MPLVQSSFRLLYAALFAVFTLFGTSMTIIGAILPRILGDFRWEYGTAGLVMAASMGAYFLTTLLGGGLLRALPPKALLAGGLACMTFGLALFAASPEPLPNALLNALVGLGQGICEVVVNWAILRIAGGQSGRAMSLAHGGFAVGAVAGPLLMGAIVALGLPWTIVYRGIAAIFGLLAAAILLLPLGELGREEAPPAAAGADRLSRKPAYWLGFACLLVYVGAEMGLSNWIAEFFVKVFAADPARASLTVSLFWIGLLAGRFGSPLLFHRARQDFLMVASSFLLGLSTLALALLGYAGAGPRAFLPGAALTFLAGLGCSVIYPIAVSLVGDCFPTAQSRAISFSVAGGGLGLLVFPFLASWIAQVLDIRAGFLSFAALSLATALVCALLARAHLRATRAR